MLVAGLNNDVRELASDFRQVRDKCKKKPIDQKSDTKKKFFKHPPSHVYYS